MMNVKKILKKKKSLRKYLFKPNMNAARTKRLFPMAKTGSIFAPYIITKGACIPAMAGVNPTML